MEAPQQILEAPESQRKRTWAEISADADQGSVAANSVGDVVTGDVVTLRPQISCLSFQCKRNISPTFAWGRLANRDGGFISIKGVTFHYSLCTSNQCTDLVQCF